MEELFRFSVLRPVERLVPKVTALSLGQGHGLWAELQPALNASKDGDSNEAIWSRFEPKAVEFLVSSSPTIAANPMWNELGALMTELLALGAPGASAPDAARIAQAFTGHTALNSDSIPPYQIHLGELLLAQIIVRRSGSAHLAELLAESPGLASALTIGLNEIALRLQACRVALDGPAPLSAAVTDAADDPIAAYNAALQAEINSTILLPPALTRLLDRPVLGVGLRELHVVKQHIRRYQATEIARIENILKGESREHDQTHNLSTEQDTSLTTVDTTESDKELDTNDKTSIQSEADQQVKTDSKVDGGVHAQYSSPSFKLNTDLTASYDQSTQTSNKYAANTAKDITQKAVTKVTDQVTRSQTTKIKEELDDCERQRFDNTNGQHNVAGIYQWVEKIYLAQTFNLGRHMLIDITVPEPGANLLAMAAASSAVVTVPTAQPHPLGAILMDQNKPLLDQFGRMQLDQPLNPLDLSDQPKNNDGTPNPNFYGTWVGYYGATGVEPPPLETRTCSKSSTLAYKDDDDKAVADSITIDDGYQGTQVTVTVAGIRNDNPGGNVDDDTRQLDGTVFAAVTVGNQIVKLDWFGDITTKKQFAGTLSGTAFFDPPVTGNTDFTVYGHNFDQMNVTVEVSARRTDAAYASWQLASYEKIAAGYQSLEESYAAALAAKLNSTQVIGPLGAADPDQNRTTERTELKRSCIAIFDNSNATVAGSEVMQLDPAQAAPVADPTHPQLPEPVLASAQTQGARVRWFEQAFEWENIAYVLYPYYWGRRELWLSRFTFTNDDPLFQQFLQAGYARVVVPVRIGFEAAVQFYLNTGLPWLGGDLPPIGDDSQNPLYLDVAEEIKALTGGGEEGDLDIPIGDPWEYVLPTTTIMLRADGTLPQWHRIADATGAESPALPSDAPVDPWTWREGAPTP